MEEQKPPIKISIKLRQQNDYFIVSMRHYQCTIVTDFMTVSILLVICGTNHPIVHPLGILFDIKKHNGFVSCEGGQGLGLQSGSHLYEILNHYYYTHDGQVLLLFKDRQFSSGQLELWFNKLYLYMYTLCLAGYSKYCYLVRGSIIDSTISFCYLKTFLFCVTQYKYAVCR